MKKVVLGLLVAVFASVGITSTSVSAAPPQTSITGVVTEAQVAVPGASVTVLCSGHTETDTTNAQGAYLVNYPSADCPFGSTVKVTAQKDGKSGVASGTVEGKTTKLNLAIVNVEIPEYGLIGALMAGGMGAGFIAYRRRQQNIAAAS
jgi:hypothetical protein